MTTTTGKENYIFMDVSWLICILLNLWSLYLEHTRICANNPMHRHLCISNSSAPMVLGGTSSWPERTPHVLFHVYDPYYIFIPVDTENLKQESRNNALNQFFEEKKTMLDVFFYDDSSRWVLRCFSDLYYSF